MNRYKKLMILFLSIIIVGVNLCGCTKKVESITLSANNIEMRVDDVITLKSVVLPEDHGEKLTWKSVDSDIATVDEDGVVKAKKEGNTTIILSSDSGKSASCAIKVLQKTAYSQLDAKYQEFVDLFVKKALPTFIDPSSIQINNLYCWEFEFTKSNQWVIDVSGNNTFGGVASGTHIYQLNEGTESFGTPLYYDGWLDPYEKISSTIVSLINKAIKEKQN